MSLWWVVRGWFSNPYQHQAVQRVPSLIPRWWFHPVPRTDNSWEIIALLHVHHDRHHMCCWRKTPTTSGSANARTQSMQGRERWNGNVSYVLYINIYIYMQKWQSFVISLALKGREIPRIQPQPLCLFLFVFFVGYFSSFILLIWIHRLPYKNRILLLMDCGSVWVRIHVLIVLRVVCGMSLIVPFLNIELYGLL